MATAHHLAIAVCAPLLLALPALAQGHLASAAPLAVSVPMPPTPAEIGGSTRLFYEFHVANFAQQPGVISELTVYDGRTGAVLNDIKGAALAPLMVRSGAKAGDKDFLSIPVGGIATIFMETTLPTDGLAPADLRWKIDFRTDTARSTASEPPIEGTLPIRPDAPMEIGFPLPPGDWFAGNGPSNTSSHRRTLLVVDGRARIAQRYAIDWMKLGPEVRLFHGDKALNASWYGFGAPVLAVADATVSTARDGIQENEPADNRPDPITLDNIAGNYLILDLGAGRYAFYAHLQPGSERVKVGDKVRRGQVLALLGNTGNSGAPHLHFDIADTNSALGAEGLPYAFTAYQSLGKAIDDSITGPSGWKPAPGSTIVTRAHAMPEEDDVVRIP